MMNGGIFSVIMYENARFLGRKLEYIACNIKGGQFQYEPFMPYSCQVFHLCKYRPLIVQNRGYSRLRVSSLFDVEMWNYAEESQTSETRRTAVFQAVTDEVVC
jgi:hypothetical protein